MIGRVILWLAVLWVPGLLWVQLANEAKWKKNIAVGVTMPLEGREDPVVQDLLRRYRTWVGRACGGSMAMGLVLALLPLSMGESLTLCMVWVDGMLAATALPFLHFNGRLRQEKQVRGWRRPAAAQERVVDLSALEGWGRELSPLHFLLPGLVSLAPVAGEWMAGAQVRGLVLLTFPLCVALFYCLYRWCFRRRAEVVDDNGARTQALTCLRLRYWQRTALCGAWLMGGMSLALWWGFYSPVAAGVVMAVLTVGAVAAMAAMELGLRRRQEELTADSGQGFYVDEDDKWLWGMFYYDPNDRKLVVNNRVGNNTTVNLARPAGKVLMGAVALLMAALPLLGLWLVEEERTPVCLTLTQTQLVAEHRGVVYAVERADIAGVELLAQRPEGMRRNVGTAMDTVLKGDWSAAAYKRMSVCLDPRQGPWLLITTQSGECYLLGDSAPGVAEALFQQLDGRT